MNMITTDAPAKVIRKLTEAEKQGIIDNALLYVRHAAEASFPSEKSD